MKRDRLFLFIAGFLVHAWIAGYQSAPGYMDADYYFLGGLQLSRGAGFSEDVLWNYLDDPAGLPHPSHAYWLPGTSLIAALSGLLRPNATFDQAQWGFVLLAALVPVLTYSLAEHLYAAESENARRRAARLAGGLALFPGYYAGFLTTTDSFGLYMVLGAAFMLAALSETRPFGRAAALGLTVGLMHLTRTDGVLWLIPAAWILWVSKNRAGIVVMPAAYLAVMAPWFIRNLNAFGAPFAPGGTAALWWTQYDDLFAFPADQLTVARWWASGPWAIIGDRLSAGFQNLTTAFAVGGMVFLFPLILAGARRLRGQLAVQGGLLGWGLGFLLMTVLFPYAGARGGFYHAGAAVQPLLWALVPAGFEVFLDWGARVRGWQVGTARRVFGVGLVVIAALVTGFLVWVRVVNPAVRAPAEAPLYQQAESFLVGAGAEPDEIVMVNNPPGYNLESGRPAIVIPSGGIEAILAAAARYGAGYLVLGPEQGLDSIYLAPEGQRGLELLGEVGELKIFGFEDGNP